MSTRDDTDRLALLQGTLDVLILRTLIFGPQHGQGIARAIQQTSEDVLLVDHGALYPALQRLEAQGWISAKWGTSANNRKARFYTLTRKRARAAGAAVAPVAAPCRRDGARARTGAGARLMRPFWRRRTHEDFSDEVQAHLDLETERLIADGLEPGRGARGPPRRRVRQRRRGPGALPRSQPLDLARAGSRRIFATRARGLRHSPAFVATIGAHARGRPRARHGRVHRLQRLRPPSVRRSAIRQPAPIAWRSPEAGGQAFRWRDYQELRERRDLFDAVIAEDTRFVSSNGRPLVAALVSDNYFEALGPAHAARADRCGAWTPARAARLAVVLSHQAWTRLFGATRPRSAARWTSTAGRSSSSVSLREFTGLDDSPRDVWMPLPAYAALAAPDLHRRQTSRARSRSARACDPASPPRRRKAPSRR